MGVGFKANVFKWPVSSAGKERDPCCHHSGHSGKTMRNTNTYWPCIKSRCLCSIGQLLMVDIVKRLSLASLFIPWQHLGNLTCITRVLSHRTPCLALIFQRTPWSWQHNANLLYKMSFPFSAEISLRLAHGPVVTNAMAVRPKLMSSPYIQSPQPSELINMLIKQSTKQQMLPWFLLLIE